MQEIRFKGLEDLEKKLKKNVKMDDVKKVVSANGVELTNRMTKEAEFKKGYKTETTKRSIPASSPELSDNGLTVTVGATTEYAEYLEVGTRFMEAQPFAAPAFNAQKKFFEKDMKKLVR